MAPSGIRSINSWSWLTIRQTRAIKSIDLIAFASISLAPSYLDDRRNGRQSDGYSHGWWNQIRRARTTKRRAKNKLLERHPARGLNLGDHTNQEAHDAPWFGARYSNTGIGLAILGGAPLCHSCYGGVSRKNWPYIYGLNTKAVNHYIDRSGIVSIDA